MNSSFVLIFFALTASLVLYRMGPLRGIARGNPCWYFALMNWIMAAGSLPMLEHAKQVDLVHAYVLLASGLVYSLTAAVFLRTRSSLLAHSRSFWALKVESFDSRQIDWIARLMLLSAAISIIYFVLVGYNLLLLGIWATITGQEVDFVSLRLNSYAGDSYFAPGYVNQFKNVLFPCTVTLLIWHRKRQRKPVRYLWLLVPVAVLFLAGAGQRGAAVVFALVVLTFLTLLGGDRSRSTLSMMQRARIGLVILGVFGVVTLLQGRVADGESVVFAVIESFVDRIFRSNQQSGVEGFRVVYGLDVRYGAEWLDAGLGLLPGHRGSDLSSIVYSRLYGGFRGTSPVSVWGSFWHNGGWVGVVLGAAVLARSHVWIYERMIKGDRKPERMMSYAVVVVLSATWVAGPFTYLLNSGVPAAVLLLWVLRRARAAREAHRFSGSTPTRSSVPIGS